MKKGTVEFFTVLVVSLLTLNSCNTNKPKNLEEKLSFSNFLYRDSFLLENLPRTLAYCRESKLINDSKDIPQSLIGKWLHPFSIQGGYENKMLSYQLKGEKYHSLLLLVVGDQLSDSASYQCYDTRQYLLTVGDSGNFIDGLKVQGYESGLDSVVNNKPVVMVIATWSKFNQDTIHIFDKTNYLQETEISKTEILQEEFEESDETIYLIDSFGKIKKAEERKGKLKKLSEGKIEKANPDSAGA